MLQVVDLLYNLQREKAEKRYKSRRVPVVYIRQGLDKSNDVSEAAQEEFASEEGEGEAQVGWYENNECPMLLVTMEEL